MTDAIDQNSGSITGPATAHRRGGYGKWLLIALAAVVLLYVLSPYYAFWRFTSALRAGDRNELATTVDFTSLRKSLKQQLRSKIAPPSSATKEPKKDGLFAGLSAEFGPRLIDTLVDAYITPEGLAAFLANPKVPTDLGAAAAATTAPPADAADAAPAPTGPAAETVPSTEPGFRSIDWSSVRYAFFTGPRDFAVDVQGTKMLFRFEELRWQLKAVELEIGEIKL